MVEFKTDDEAETYVLLHPTERAAVRDRHGVIVSYYEGDKFKEMLLEIAEEMRWL